MKSHTAANSDPKRFEVLDGMRGIAALMVMIYHYNMYFDYGVFSKLFMNIFTAVDFFFVLSGFVVSHAYADKLRGGLSARDYVYKRVARLYPLALAGMAIGIPVFYWKFVGGGADVYSLANMMEILGCNVLGLPYFGGGGEGRIHFIFPIDGPLWSIFFEMFASIAFIWLVRQPSRRLAWIAGVAYIGLIVAAARLADAGTGINIGYSQENFLGGFPRVVCSFVGGMLLYRLWKARPAGGFLGILQKSRIRNPAPLYLGLIAMLCVPLYIKGLYQFLVVIAAAPYMVVQGSQAQCRSAGMRRASWLLGWLSYPVYCLHRPIGEGIALLHAHGVIMTTLPLQTLAIPATLLTSALVLMALKTVMPRTT
jgi:peptidoglycan/LPS O-acetylase OafA/YrhL